MRLTRVAASLLFAVICAAQPNAQTQTQPTVPTVTKASGGSVKTVLDAASQIVVNKESSLMREWIAVHDPAMPMRLEGTPGVTTIYEDGQRYSSGNYRYSSELQFTATEPVSAVEIRFLTFDVWGEPGRVLSVTEVKDFPAGTHPLIGKWNLYSENEASEFYASIAYVARVRTKQGKVIRADPAPVVAEARMFSKKFTEADLEPQKPKPRD